MKKTLKFIILLLIGLFININKVDAKTFKLYEEGHTDVGSVNLYRYYINGDDGNKVTLYCRDAGLYAPTTARYPDGVEMSITPLDPSNAHDAGLIEIMEHGKANGFSYEAINMAIRFYEYMFGRVDVVTKQKDLSDTAINDRDEVIVNIVDNIRLAEKYVSQWFKDSDLSAAGAKRPYNAIAGDKTYKGWIESYGKSTSTDGVYLDSEKISISQIQELLQAGINEAKTVLTGNSTTRTETSITKPFEPLIKDYSDDAMYIKEITYTFSTKGFDTKKDSILMKFNCEECDNYNIDYKIRIEGNDILGTDLDDIKAGKLELIDKYVDKENDTLEVILTFSAIKSTFDCANKPNYSIEFKYTGEQKQASYAQYDFPGRTWSDQVYIGDHWEIVTGSEDGGSFSGGTGGSAGENNDDKDYPGIYVETGKVELCEDECEALKNKCDKYKEENPWDPNYNVNNESCKKYVELKCDPGDDTPEEELAKCNVYVSSATCSETPSELTIREGTGGNSPCDDSGVSVYGCVTRKGAADNNGNEYKQTTMQPNNAYRTTFEDKTLNVSNNRFCNVACIENYHITLPPSQNDNAGRYFQLSAEIKGNKSCYTSIKKGDQTNPLSSSNAGTFEYMFEEERLKNEEYYYMYSFYKAIQDAIAADNKAITDKTKKYETTKTGTTQDGWGGPTVDKYKSYYEYTLNFVDGNASSRFFDNYLTNTTSLDGIGIFTFYSKSQAGFFEETNKITKFEYKDVSSSTCAYFGANKDACYLSIPYFTIQCKKGNNNQVTCTIRSYSTEYKDGDIEHATNGLLSLRAILGSEDSGKIYSDKSKSFSYKFLKDLYDEDFNYTKYDNNVNNASNGIQSTINKMKTYEEELAQCVGWNMKFKFNPTLTFDYEEEYINEEHVNKQLEPVSDGDASDTEITTPDDTKYCAKQMKYDKDGKYESCDDLIGSNLYPEREVSLYEFDEDNNPIPNKKTFHISNATTAYQTIDVDQNYVTPVQFRTLSPSGVIVLMDGNSQQIDDSLIVPGWPLEFAHKGVYTYKISVKDLGEFNDGKTLGRIWDDDEQNVVKKAEADKASTCASEKSSIDKDGNYFCSYNVNCNNCPTECDPKYGICEDPRCPDCPSSCNPDKGACIVDGELNVSPRPVSPNNINPNKRPLGKNWSWDENGITTYMELKAYITTQEIQDAGENVFDVDFGAEYTESNIIGNNYAVKFNLTSDVINYIKEYNQGKTYSDNSLDCYPYTNENTQETFDGMFCYSRFIDQLMEDKENAVEIKGTRPDKNSREAITGNHSWWTTWDQAEQSVERWKNGPVTFSINSSSTIDLDNLHFATDSGTQIGIGPAWK